MQTKASSRTEVYRLRNEEELKIFKEATSNTKRFTRCFVGEGDVRDQGKRWLKVLQKTIHTWIRPKRTDKTKLNLEKRKARENRQKGGPTKDGGREQLGQEWKRGENHDSR